MLILSGNFNIEKNNNYTDLINKYSKEGNLTKFSCGEDAIKYNNPNGKVSSITFKQL